LKPSTQKFACHSPLPNLFNCRSREFLWQEGHTAFATKAEADEEVGEPKTFACDPISPFFFAAN